MNEPLDKYESMCPLLSASAGFKKPCRPDCCMWAMRKTAMGDDGQYRTVGYRCAVANGSDRYVEMEWGE